MATPRNDFKLGLFVVLVAGAIIGTAVAFGVWSRREPTVAYYTYFDESVQGLDIGAPVNYRGVGIGKVTRIEIAPDRRHVQARLDLLVRDIRRLRLAQRAGTETRFIVPPDLRAQLGSQGITGVKFVSIDFFDERANPAPHLPFTPHENYIPATKSTLKGLEDVVLSAVDRLPELSNALVAVASRAERLLAKLEDDEVSRKAAATLDQASAALRSFDTTLRHVDNAHLGERAAKTMDRLQGAVVKIDRILDRVDGDAGVIASVLAATDAFGDVGRNAGATSRDFEDALREISEAAVAIKNLARALERDPDMLVKGRAKARSQ